MSSVTVENVHTSGHFFVKCDTDLSRSGAPRGYTSLLTRSSSLVSSVTVENVHTSGHFFVKCDNDLSRSGAPRGWSNVEIQRYRSATVSM